MMAKRCLYKRYHLLNISLDNSVSFSSALSESRRFFPRSLSLRSLASAASEPRQFFVAYEELDCAARLVLSLPRRLDDRGSSSSEARLIFLRYLSLVKMLQFYARVVVELELRYVQRPLLASGSEPT